MKPLAFLLIVLCLCGCHKTQPQSPSSRSGESPKVDTTLLSLMSINQRLAEEADREIIAYVQKQDIPFAQAEIGYWIYLPHRISTGNTPKKDEQWTIRMITKTLDGKLLEDSEQTYRIQREELPRSVEDAIQEMHHGENAQLVTPWYTAYGQQGKEGIPPYTNLLIELFVR